MCARKPPGSTWGFAHGGLKVARTCGLDGLRRLVGVRYVVPNDVDLESCAAVIKGKGEEGIGHSLAAVIKGKGWEGMRHLGEAAAKGSTRLLANMSPASGQGT